MSAVKLILLGRSLEIVNVERFYGLDADKIDQVNGQVLIKYSEVAGIISKECFFS